MIPEIVVRFTVNNKYAIIIVYGLLLCYGIWMLYNALTGAFRMNRKTSAIITGLQAAFVILVTISSIANIDTEDGGQKNKFLKQILKRAKIKNELDFQGKHDSSIMNGGNDDLRTKKQQ